MTIRRVGNVFFPVLLDSRAGKLYQSPTVGSILEEARVDFGNAEEGEGKSGAKMVMTDDGIFL